MKISTRQVDKSAILDVSGNIDMSNAQELRKALLTEIGTKGASRVVVNLGGVGYIDSAGIASLVEGLKASRDSHVRFILFGISPSALEVLKVVRLEGFFEIHDNETQALQA